MANLPKAEVRRKVAVAGAAFRAGREAAQTPEEVRKAFLTRTHTVGPLVLQPFSFGILWLFEELKHPFNEPDELLRDAAGNPVPLLDAAGKPQLKDGQPLYQAKPMSLADTARAIYVFADPEGAAETLATGMEAFDTAAKSLAFGIAPKHLPAINRTIKTIFAEGLATIPGAGAGNPPPA
jgi:hypothetical protein